MEITRFGEKLEICGTLFTVCRSKILGLILEKPCEK
jgi:hypothetical protein